MLNREDALKLIATGGINLNLAGTNLQGADLQSANLRGADLDGA